MNARFWVYGNHGWVKLTLKPNQSLSWYQGAPDEEGFHYRKNTWMFNGNTVYDQYGSGGRDCDGRIDHAGCSKCSVSRLRDVQAYLDSDKDGAYIKSTAKDALLGIYAEAHCDGKRILRPEWVEHRKTRVFDQYAQMANY